MRTIAQLNTSQFILDSFLFLLLFGIASLAHFPLAVLLELLDALLLHLDAKRLGLLGFELRLLLLAQLLLALDFRN